MNASNDNRLQSMIVYLNQEIDLMQRGADKSTIEHVPQWLAARNVLRMARDYCYTLQPEPALAEQFNMPASKIAKTS